MPISPMVSAGAALARVRYEPTAAGTEAGKQDNGTGSNINEDSEPESDISEEDDGADPVYSVDAIKWAEYRDTRRTQMKGHIGWYYGVMWSGYLETGSDTVETLESFEVVNDDGVVETPMIDEFWKAVGRKPRPGTKEPGGKIGELIETPRDTLKSWFKAAKPKRYYETYKLRREKELAQEPLTKRDSDYYHRKKVLREKAKRVVEEGGTGRGPKKGTSGSDKTTSVGEKTGPTATQGTKRKFRVESTSPPPVGFPPAESSKMAIEAAQRKSPTQTQAQAQVSIKTATPPIQSIPLKPPKRPTNLANIGKISKKSDAPVEQPLFLPANDADHSTSSFPAQPTFGMPDPGIFDLPPPPVKRESQPPVSSPRLFDWATDLANKARQAVMNIAGNETAAVPKTAGGGTAAKGSNETATLLTPISSSANPAPPQLTTILVSEAEPPRVSQASPTLADAAPDPKSAPIEASATSITETQLVTAATIPPKSTKPILLPPFGPSDSGLSHTVTKPISLLEATASESAPAESSSTTANTTSTTAAPPNVEMSTDVHATPDAFLGDGLPLIPAYKPFFQRRQSAQSVTPAPPQLKLQKEDCAITAEKPTATALAPISTSTEPAEVIEIGSPSPQPEKRNSTEPVSRASSSSQSGTPTSPQKRPAPGHSKAMERALYVQPKRIKTFDDLLDPSHNAAVKSLKGTAVQAKTPVVGPATSSPQAPGSANGGPGPKPSVSAYVPRAPVNVKPVPPIRPPPAGPANMTRPPGTSAGDLVHASRTAMAAGHVPPRGNSGYPAVRPYGASYGQPTYPHMDPNYATSYAQQQQQLQQRSMHMQQHTPSLPMVGQYNESADPRRRKLQQPASAPLLGASPYQGGLPGQSPSYMPRSAGQSPLQGGHTPFPPPGQSPSHPAIMSPQYVPHSGGGTTPEIASVKSSSRQNLELTTVRLTLSLRGEHEVSIPVRFWGGACETGASILGKMISKGSMLCPEEMDVLHLDGTMKFGAKVVEWAKASFLSSVESTSSNDFDFLKKRTVDSAKVFVSYTEPCEPILCHHAIVLVSTQRLNLDYVSHLSWPSNMGGLVVLLLALPLISDTVPDLPNPVRPDLNVDKSSFSKPVNPSGSLLETYGLDESFLQSCFRRKVIYYPRSQGPTDRIFESIQKALKACEAIGPGDSVPDIIFIGNGKIQRTLHSTSIRTCLGRRTRFFSFGPALQLPPSQWGLKQVWSRGGLVTFSPTFILRSPDKFGEIMAMIRISQNWDAYIIPAVIEWTSLSRHDEQRCPNPGKAMSTLTNSLFLDHNLLALSGSKASSGGGLAVSICPPPIHLGQACVSWISWLQSMIDAQTFSTLVQRSQGIRADTFEKEDVSRFPFSTEVDKETKPLNAIRGPRDDDLTLEDIEIWQLEDLARMRARPHVLPYRRYIHIGEMALSEESRRKIGAGIEFVKADDFTAVLSGSI